MIIACICGGIGEVLYLLIWGIVSLLGALGIKFGWSQRKKIEGCEEEDCHCTCHGEDGNIEE